MGIFALAMPSLLFFGRSRRHAQPYDPEKADRQDTGRSVNDDHPELDHEDSDDDQDRDSNDVLSTNTPHRRIRRVYSNVTRTFHEHAQHDASSLTLATPTPSLWSRIKEYVWPSDDPYADLDSFVPNYRWTPIISGVMIPFSILLEIPGLTEHWYIRTEGSQTVDSKSNSSILEAGITISVVCAVIANIALVLRFLEKRVKTVTLLCIAFLTIHDVINIITVVTFGIEHRFNDGFTYGEAYWMTLCSTIASSVTNITLIVDFYRTPDFAKKGSGLTRKQRALMIIVIILLVYIAFGALINSIILDLTFINGLYFTVVSIETIGFGDIVPVSTGARIWTCFYIAFGIVCIGVAIAMCRETILEGLEIGYRRRLRNMRERRRDARRFRRWEARWQDAVEFRLREAGQPIWVADKHDDNNQVKVLSAIPGVKTLFFMEMGTKFKRTATMTSVDTVFRGHHHRKKHLNVEALTATQLEAAALEAGVPLEMFCDVEDRRNVQRNPSYHARDAERLPGHAPSAVVHTFHDAISSGWPAYSQTPTHAQVGRMAAMMTKFAIAVSGNHTHPPAQPHSEYVQRQEETHPDRPPSHDATAAAGAGSRPPMTRGGSYTSIKNHPAAKALKDFVRGPSHLSGRTYEQYKEDMAAEEKRAMYAKLTIAWLLFILFWMVGSGIFCATEGWSYGTAMYFCFVAFTTTGYGDLTPQTPAGRSVFVVWALFGVGTLTILVSVLQEAGSSRYKSALHSRLFDKAVKKYRKNIKQAQDGKQPHSFPERKTLETSNSNGAAGRKPFQHRQESKSTSERLKESEENVRRTLQTLPTEIIRNARTFHDYMQFFITGGTDGMNVIDEAGVDVGKPKIPPDMQKLLDELGKMEGINDRVKAEIMQDEDAKKTLFMLSLERSLKRLVTSAEKALLALTERDDALRTLAATRETTRGRRVSLRRPLVLSTPDEDDREGGEDRARAQSEPPSPMARRGQAFTRAGSSSVHSNTSPIPPRTHHAVGEFSSSSSSSVGV